MLCHQSLLIWFIQTKNEYPLRTFDDYVFCSRYLHNVILFQKVMTLLVALFQVVVYFECCNLRISKEHTWDWATVKQQDFTKIYLQASKQFVECAVRVNRHNNLVIFRVLGTKIIQKSIHVKCLVLEVKTDSRASCV